MQERYHSISLDEILNMEEKGDLYLPNFQRQFRWRRKRQKKLLSSFIVGIPIGGILLLEGEGEEFASRKLCYEDENRAHSDGDCIYLLDGQQRVSTLKSVFHDFFRDPDGWEDEWNKLYSGLKNRWFLNLAHDPEQIDIFGIDDLIFEEESIFSIDAGDMEKHIICRKMLKKHKSKWFNPQYINEEIPEFKEDRNMLLRFIADEAAQNCEVPLFSIRSDDPVPLHESAVEIIAEKRTRTLKAEVDDGKRDIIDLLKPVEPSIEDHVERGSEKKIESAWDRLSNRWVNSIMSMLDGLIENKIPRIRLGSDEIDRAVSIFDNMNKGGTPLSTFDLVVARAAKEKRKESSLTDRINDQLSREFEIPDSLTGDLVDPPSKWNAKVSGVLDDDTPPTKTTRKQVLNLLSVLTFGLEDDIDNLEVRHIKKKEHLNLSSEQINSNYVDATLALKRALAFLQLRCGIERIGDISYDLTIIPVAYCLYHDNIWEYSRKLDRIEYWYWTSIFSGHYREKQNPRCIEDTKILFEWVQEGGKDPFENRFDSTLDEPGYSDESMLLRQIPQPDQYGVPAAVSETILQYILSNQPYDFLPEKEFPKPVRLSAWDFALSKEVVDKEGNTFEMNREAHHICPLADATSISENADELRGSKEHILNSPVNLTYISSEANKRIRDKRPSEYVNYLSGLSLTNHSLPPSSEIKRKEEEPKEEYYNRFTKRRYELLKSNLREELDRLRS